MTNTDVISRVRAAKGRLAEIARRSGVPEKTLEKIYYGATANPRMDTLEALRKHFEREDRLQ